MHQDKVYSAAFSPDGARVWEVAETDSLAAWSTQAESCLATPTDGVPFVRCELSERKPSIL